MNHFEIFFGLSILVIIAFVFLGPMLVLRIKGNSRGDERPTFQVMGTLVIRGGGSILQTHRFNVFSNGLLICGLFSERFVSRENIKSVYHVHKNLNRYIEVELESGSSIRISSTNNKKLARYLDEWQ